MNTTSLFLIQSSFNKAEQDLNQLNDLYATDDSIVLMAEAVLHVNHPFLQTVDKIYILEKDADLLSNKYPNHVKILSYPQFAELCLTYTRCISLK